MLVYVSTMLSVESSGQREGCGPKYPMIKGYGETLLYCSCLFRLSCVHLNDDELKTFQGLP